MDSKKPGSSGKPTKATTPPSTPQPGPGPTTHSKRRYHSIASKYLEADDQSNRSSSSSSSTLLGSLTSESELPHHKKEPFTHAESTLKHESTPPGSQDSPQQPQSSFIVRKGKRGSRNILVKLKSLKKKKRGKKSSKIHPSDPTHKNNHEVMLQNLEKISLRMEDSKVDTTADGLSSLEFTDHLYVVRKRGEKLPFPHDDPTRSYFKVLNSAGQHIFTAAQMDFEFRVRKFVMDIFSVDGIPILMVVQRNVDRFRSLSVDWDQMKDYFAKDKSLPRTGPGPGAIPYEERPGGFIAYAFQMDDNRLAFFKPWKEDEQEVAQVHVRHANGKCLGHIWKGVKSWIIFDSKICPAFVFQEKHSYYPVSLLSKNQRKRFPPCSSGAGWFRKLYSYYEYYAVPAPPRSPNDYLLDSPMGFIEAHLKLDRLGIVAEPKDCFGARIPQHLTNVEKALILGMLLSLVRKYHNTQNLNAIYSFL